MTRQIVTRRDAARSLKAGAESGGSKERAGTADGYITRILKYVPVEGIALFALVNGILQDAGAAVSTPALSWSVFGVIAALTPLYLWRVQKVRRLLQLVVSTTAFCVWVFYVGGPFLLCAWYQPLYGAILLPIFTFGIGILEPDF